MPSNNYFREQHDIMHYYYFILVLIMNSNILRTRASNPHYLASNTANITYIRTSLRRSVRTLNNALCMSFRPASAMPATHAANNTQYVYNIYIYVCYEIMHVAMLLAQALIVLL